MRASMLAGLLVAITLAPLGAASAEQAPQWTTDFGGPVTTFAQANDVVYVGGTFSAVGRPSGQGVWVDAIGGERQAKYPTVSGEVDAVAADGSGGWFIGGRFAFVSDRPRRCLAHVLSDGSVADWNP